MKKFLLLGTAVLIAVSASGATPIKCSDPNIGSKSQLTKQETPKANKEYMEMRKPGIPVVKAPKKADYIEVWYKRPAGAWFVNYISVDGSYGYAYSSPFLFMKPFTEYCWHGYTDPEDPKPYCTWDFFCSRGDNDADPDNPYVIIDDEKDICMSFDIEIDNVPIFYAVDGPMDDENSTWYQYQMLDYDMENTTPPTKVGETPVQVFSLPSHRVFAADAESDIDYWGSSKTMVGGGRNADSYYLMTAYYGAEPYGDNEYGWWFGKNGDHIDGQAVAFEKPAAPYLLKRVGWRIADDAVINDPITLTCKVYKLNSIPAYSDEGSVRLPEEPGELIVTGEATVNSTEELAENYGMISFTLYAHDEEDPDLVYEFTPTIDSPILVCIDGYNDPEAENLADFTSYISTDDAVDEGYGELAYLKYPVYEMEVSEDGDTSYNYTGEHVWRGLNNFFRSGEMKTAFSIYISTENPFLVYNLNEDGKYQFPVEGGDLQKVFEYSDTTIVSDGIQFFASYPSDDWTMTYKGSEDLPGWLTIKLEDAGTYATGNVVVAKVTAEPLPADVKYREAAINFEIPGAAPIKYRFSQGDGLLGDVNHDGLVNISDINAVINMILAGTFDADGDINGDGAVNIGDINALIAIILG